MIGGPITKGLLLTARAVAISPISLEATFGVAAPGLQLSASSIPENSAPGTTIGVAVPVAASNPGAVSIVSQTLAGAIAMTGDGITFAVGAAGGAAGTLNHEVTPFFTVVFEYTDDNGTYQFTRGFTITDVADGPTITGAATSLQAMVGTPQAGVQVAGDLDGLFVSPTGQTLIFTASHGSIGAGNAWTWTPAAGGSTTVSVTAEDEDGQTLQIEVTVDVAPAAPVNNAPVAGGVMLEFLVPPPAAGVAPSNTVAPALSGTAKVASSLTSSSGTWTGDAPISYGYQWQRSDDGATGWANVSGATNNAYTLQAADDLKYLRCVVTGTNGTGNASANSNASAQITYNAPANTAVPSVTGTAQVGQTLTTDGGTWTNSPTGYARKWQVSDDGSTGWTDISGATAATYDLTAGETAKYVRSAVTATNSGGSTTAYSAATAQITAPDVTAPVLSSPVDAASGSTAATGSVSTDEGNGTLWWVVSTSGTAPTKAQVKAGQDHTGAAAADAGSQAVSGTGVQTLSPAPSGLTASTAYTIHFMHEDAAANQSTVASGDGFTTAAASGITGYDIPQILKTPGTPTYASTFALGNITGVAVGDLVHVHLHAMGNSAVLNPANFAATLGGVAMTGGVASGATSSGVFPGSRLLTLVAAASGDLALDVDLGVSCRTALAVCTLIKGLDAGTPIGQTFAPGSLAADASALDLPPGGLTTGKNGNVYLTSVNIKGGGLTGPTLTGLDGYSSASTGADTSKHITVGYGWALTPAAAALSPASSWSPARRCAALGSEVNVA